MNLCDSLKKTFSNLDFVIANVLSITFPLVFGIITNKIELGQLAALGGLAVSNIEKCQDNSKGKIYVNLVYALVTTNLAMIFGSLCSQNHYLGLIMIPVIVFVACLIGGISRNAVRATTIFIIFMIITSSLNDRNDNYFLHSFFYGIGTICAIILIIFSYHTFNLFYHNESKVSTIKQPSYTLKQLFTYWKKKLNTFAGWQFSVRMIVCILCASLIVLLFPFKHDHWILITVVIVMQRNADNLLKRVWDRSIGTIIGIALFCFFTIIPTSHWITMIVIVILSLFKMILREANYMAYSISMTPLILLILDFNQKIELESGLYRLLATIYGCSIVLVFGYLLWMPLLKKIAVDTPKRKVILKQTDGLVDVTRQ